MEHVQVEGDRTVIRKVKIYNLEMIVSIGFRINSKQGILFRRWANQVLKQYLLNGYSLGYSIKNIGKKRSVMAKLTSISKEMIIKRSK